MRKNLHHGFLKSESGAAAIEAVFIIPLLCFIFFASQDLTSLVKFNKQMSDVAQVVSDTIAQAQGTITPAQITDIEQSINLLVPATEAPNVHVDIYDYYLNGTTVTRRWQAHSAGGSTCAAPSTSAYANMMANGNDVITAVSCMNYSPWVATFMSGTSWAGTLFPATNILGAPSFTLTQTIVTAPYGAKAVTCAACAT